MLASPCLRVNLSDDVVGVEIAGALKNVLAIAAGIVEGLQLGNNAMAALTSQVFHHTTPSVALSGCICASAGHRRWGYAATRQMRSDGELCSYSLARNGVRCHPPVLSSRRQKVAPVYVDGIDWAV